MILADTSVWVDHLRAADPYLAALLLEEQVLCHPLVIGEIACGSLKRRTEILELLQSLPQAPVVGFQEVLMFIETHTLMGSGLGWVDVHLLASARLAGERLWTNDHRLARAAERLGMAG